MSKKPDKIRTYGKTLKRFYGYELEDIIGSNPRLFGIDAEPEDIHTYCEDDSDGNFTGIIVREWKLESDAEYELRMNRAKEAKLAEKRSKEKSKSKIEAQEKDTLRKLIKKYGTI